MGWFDHRLGKKAAPTIVPLVDFVAVEHGPPKLSERPAENLPIAEAVAIDEERPPPYNPSFMPMTADAPTKVPEAPKPSSEIISSSTVVHHYPPPAPAGAPTSRPLLSIQPISSRRPTRIQICPSCRLSNARTNIVTSPVWQTWLSVLLSALLFWPLCWLPLVIDQCKVTRHYCQSCGEQVGEVKAFSDCCVKKRG